MRSFLALSSVVAFVSLVAACDSPSGGGGVNCAQVPTAPACRPDTTGANDGTLPAPDGTNDGSPGTCSVGARHCAGNVPEVCQGGTWTALAACSASQTCTNGTCIDDTEPDCCQGMECGSDCGVSCGTCTGNTTCDGSGQCVPGGSCTPSCSNRECGSDGCTGTCGACGVNESCQNGQCVGNQTCSCNGAECGEDNCGNSCGTCGATDTCEGGQCVQTSAGSGTCSDLYDCIYVGPSACVDISNETQQDACVEACFGDTSENGQVEFTALISCANDCEDDRCYAQSCNEEQASCFYDKTGPGTCQDIVDCINTCADGDGECIDGCFEASTLVAQTALVGYLTCLNVECPNATDPEDPCYDTAAAGFCAQFVTACQNN